MLRAYRALFLAEFQSAAQYRVQFLLWLVGNVIRPVIFLSAWVAVAAARGGDIGGFSAGDFAAYYVGLTLVGQLTQSWNAYEFEQEVRLGRLSPKLLRPLHPVHYTVVGNLVWKAVTLPALFRERFGRLWRRNRDGGYGHAEFAFGPQFLRIF